jgi:hypothetical protein
MVQERQFSVRERRLLMQRTQELGPTEHEEIFKILQRHDVGHTQNNNGIFVNLSTVPDAVVAEVQRFVDFCFDNKQEMDDYDKRINECKLSQNYDKFMGVESTAEGAEARVEVPQQPSAAAAAASSVVVAASPPAVVASVTKRIMSSKFHQAFKRFSKKRVDRKAADSTEQSLNELVAEPYPACYANP